MNNLRSIASVTMFCLIFLYVKCYRVGKFRFRFMAMKFKSWFEKNCPYFLPKVCVCVCVRVCISFHHKGFSWLKQNNKCNARDHASDVVLRKLLCVKHPRHHVIDNHSRDLWTVQERQLNRAEPREVKDNS